MLTPSFRSEKIVTLARTKMIGQIVLHYRITERLGAGGMGVVWKATDTHLGREVALKLLLPDDNPDPIRVSRFLREARSASALNHPNIITIYEASTAGNVPFIAMEYVRGTALNEMLRYGPLGLTRSIDIALQICAALQHAHEAGIIHRDLKPSNIMLTPAGTVKVLDFGLAKRTSNADPVPGDAAASSPLTVEGTAMGTVEYMSPEQALGEAVDTRSDLFSFGVVLYELLSKARPFEAASAGGALRRIITSAPTPLRDIVPGIPNALETIVLRCLEKEPADRYGSAAEAASELRHVLSSITQASSAPTATLVMPPVRRSLLLRRTVISALAVVFVICAIFGWRYFPSLRTHRPVAIRDPSGFANEYDAFRTARGLLDRYDKKGNIDRAVEALEAAVRLNPNYALAYAGLSEAYLRRNGSNPDPQGQRQARDAADKAVKLNPDLAAAHVARGMALAESREPADRSAAAGEFGRALDLDPRSSSAHLGIAKTAAVSGDSTTAETAYQKAILLAPDEWLPMGEYGIFLYRAARYQEAAETWERARAAAPDNVRILTLVGSVYHMLDRYEDAASAFQRALEIEPSARVYTNLGTARFFQGRYADAVTAMQKALEMNGGSRSLYWGNLGDAYRWAPGRRPKSLEAYKHAIELARIEIKSAPDDSDLRASVAVYLAKSDDRKGALSELEALAKVPKLTANAWFQAALAHEILGQRELALGSLKTAINLGYSAREVRNEPELVSLRADPQFGPLLDSAGSGRH